jgi:glycosyltransferase involved in cell wall biosynthesis
MKILIVNDYPLDKYFVQWKNGLTPSQQLWGKVELDRENGLEVIILPHEKYKFLDRIGNIFNIQHLDQQWRALLIKNDIDIIYAPFAAATTKFLLLLKFFGLINTPIIAVIHYPLLGSNSNKKVVRLLGKRLMKGFDRMLFISHNIKRDNIEAFSLAPHEYEKRFVHLNWGAETAFYDSKIAGEETGHENYAISAGQTDRDFDTLIDAFRKLDLKLKIYSRPGYKPQSNDIPKNVEIFTNGVTYKELLDIYKKSKMILICFKIRQESTLGITSLFDAMAMGKPVIITENSYIDIDVEKEGIGYWVAEGDVQGWISKIQLLIDNPEQGKIMGQNTLALQKNKYNMDLFGIKLKSIINDLYEEKVK